MRRVIAGRVEVPVIVSEYVPLGVLKFVATRNNELEEPPAVGVTAGGEKLVVEFAGKPETCRFTGALKLPTEVTVTV